MAAFAIAFGAGRFRRYLTQARREGLPENGWRALVWTRDITRAELFGCADSARRFGDGALTHQAWDVVVAPTRGIPTDDFGGSPAAMRAAA